MHIHGHKAYPLVRDTDNEPKNMCHMSDDTKLRRDIKQGRKKKWLGGFGKLLRAGLSTIVTNQRPELGEGVILAGTWA